MVLVLCSRCDPHREPLGHAVSYGARSWFTRSQKHPLHECGAHHLAHALLVERGRLCWRSDAVGPSQISGSAASMPCPISVRTGVLCHRDGDEIESVYREQLSATRTHRILGAHDALLARGDGGAVAPELGDHTR